MKSLGSRLLSEEILKREISFQTVANELTAQGKYTQRYSVWQWVNDVAKPSLPNALAIATWSSGKIPPEAWTKKAD